MLTSSKSISSSDQLLLHQRDSGGHSDWAGYVERARSIASGLLLVIQPRAVIAG